MVTSKLKKQSNKHKTPWFWAFWLLLGILILSLLGIYHLASVNTKVADQQSKISKTDATFEVSLNKKQANALVSYYLSDTNNSDFQFRVEDHIMLYGRAKFLGEYFKFGMMMSPEVTKNGNVILTAKKITIGNLPLPISTIMAYVKSNYNAPDFVTINAKKKEIFINMAKLPSTKGMAFRAKTIDLNKDQFIFQGGLASDKK